MKQKANKRKVLISSAAILISFLIVGIVFAATSLNRNNYVVDVVKEEAISKDDNLQISERIIKEEKKEDFGSTQLNYEVELKNIVQSDMTTEVAFLIDSSYSIGTNDNLSIGKAKAKELAQGILTKVKDVKVSVSSNANANVVTLRNNTTANITAIKNGIDGIAMTSINNCNQGLDYAYSTFSKRPGTEGAEDINRYLIVITDGTDDTSEKMLSLKEADPNLQIITILVDITSTAYINNGLPVCGEVYLLQSDENSSNNIENVEVLDSEKIYNEINKINKNINVTNKFLDKLIDNFEITDFSATQGEVTVTKNDKGNIDGYIWKLDKLEIKQTQKLSFKITLKNQDIDAGLIFQEISTNKEQDVKYSKYDSEENINLNGTDQRSETDSTIIKICKGYELKIKAVNESNTDLEVEGVKFTIIGTRENEDESIEQVCNITKTTNSNGYITITPDDAKALRTDGRITYTVIPDVTGLLGYSKTDAVIFDITNNKITRLLDVDDYNGIGIPSPDEKNRLVEVTIPINTKKVDFEVRNEELNNEGILLSGSKFILSQPLLNDKYKMERLEGVTDKNGIVHFSPTVMTKDGVYTYYLEQESVASSYNIMEMVRIDVTFEKGKIVNVARRYNSNIDVQKVSEEHILVIARNESVTTDPFNLQINLKDEDTKEGLGPVTYLVTTIYSNGTSVSQYVQTDPKTGSADTNIYANGQFQIAITEQAPMPGYTKNTKTTTITAAKTDGEIIIWNKDTNNAIIQTNSNRENIIVDFTSKKKPEQNIVRISLVDAQETDVSVGKNVAYTLTDTETGTVYGGKSGNPAVSDRNGELSFTIDSKTQGTHKYILAVDKTTVPQDYDEEKVEEEILINISFDEDGYINDANNSIVDDQTIIESHYSKIMSDSSTEYTYFITIGYELNYDDTAVFKVKLSDKENINKALEGAKYNIEINWSINGIQRTKTIKERKTNASGEITTHITKASDVEMTVTQVSASTGYIYDNTTQEIHMNFVSDGRIQIEQTPYDRGTSNLEEPNQGVAVDSQGKEVELNRAGEIVYQHLNRKRSTEDTYINLNINKLDKGSQGYVDGVILGISSDLENANIPSMPTISTPEKPKNTLLDKNDEDLDLIMITGANGSEGTVSIDYKQYIADKINNETIRVPGIGIDGNEMVYNIIISELKVDNQSSTGYSIKNGTTVKLRLVFRYKDGEVKLTNVESYYGNNLIKNKIFSSTKDDELGVYLSNISLDLWTNYDEVGNLSLDFKKQDNNGNQLSSSYYDIKITNPDNSVIRKKNIEVKNGELSSDIELQGLVVNVDSIIEIIEKTAPIGYGINETETLRVKNIAEDGEIELEHIDSSYKIPRLELESLSTTTTTSGNLKTNYRVTLKDYMIDTFLFKIQGLDSESLEAVSGYKFDIRSSLDAQKAVTTDETGMGETKIGGNIEDGIITYTITPKVPAEYYKLSKTPIDVKVVFDISGHVDVDATMNVQTDLGYGKTWNINEVKTNGEIEVQLLLDHQDPLTVQVETLDRITGAVITDVNYKITESKVLPAIGSQTIQVGYALEDGVKTYKLEQTQIKSSYADISDKLFRINYVKGKITTCEITNDDNKNATITKTGDKSVKIVSYAEPKVPFEIRNLYYFDNNVSLQGADFKVTSIENSKEAQGTTNSSGITGIYCDILGNNNYKIYKISQPKAAIGYATVEDFYIKVHYNENQVIDLVQLTNKDGNEVTNKFVEVSYKVSEAEYNRNNKGIVTVQVLNYPEFKMNIKDIDRRNNNPIIGTQYSVKSTYLSNENQTIDFTSANQVITDETGTGIAHLDKTKENTVVTYKIKEDKPAVGYQSYGTNIDVIVTFDDEGYVTSATLTDGNTSNQTAKVKLPDNITEDPRDHLIVDVELKNNPILKFNLTAVDSADQTVKIKDIGFQVVSRKEDQIYSNSSSTNKVNQTQSPETSYTDVNGYAASYLDRTLENQKMYYTIKEVKKSPGYEWADEDIIIAITYDNNGAISTASVEQGSSLVGFDIATWIDSDNFEITLNIYNNEIKEFGIHLGAVDTYDVDKKLNDMKVEAFLVDKGNDSYVSDGQYELVGQNSLLTGSDKDGDKLPDLAYGEDYKTMGKYTKGAGTRTLRLVVKNNSKNTAQSGYYLNGNDGSSSVGYYKGTTYFADAKYQTVKYQYLINVTFDDDGKITNAKLLTGLNSDIGWLVDNRYIQVDENNNLSHTDYKLNITMKFFPMLDLKLNAMDNYTYENEVSKNGKPIALRGSRYKVSTDDGLAVTDQIEEYVTAGYIGDGHDLGSKVAYGDIYSDTDELLIPIENNYTRVFYIFEENEPYNYQKYADRHITEYRDRLVAIISVAFDEFGQIDYDNSITRIINENKVEPYMDKSGAKYLSSNNIQRYNYYFGHEDAKRDIDFYIGYGLTTKINVTAVDDISNSPISNIRMYPFINNTYCTNTSYEYNTNSYRNTDINGKFNIKYWGASQKDSINQYIINPETLGTRYNGYLFPKDMAASSLGGSSNPADYFAKLDVVYGTDGKIAKVTSIGHDLWGDNNISPEITWDSNTGNVYINMLFSRKFQVQTNKSDYYDSTINNLAATFNVISNKGLNIKARSNEMLTLGKVYKDQTIKYTLSESIAPPQYYPLEKTIDLYVTFDANGNIGTRSVKTDDPEYLDIISTSKDTKQANKTSPDLTISVKDKPAFILDLRVIDKFYKNDGIKDIYLDITNNKGDKGAGNPQTDTRGYTKGVIIGPVYPNEEVIYYIKQLNKAPDYYKNSTTIELHVKFNKAGKIEKYWIQNGDEVVNNFDGSKHNNNRNISINIMNMPENIKIGLYKYDQTKNIPMAGVSFTITRQDTSIIEEGTKKTIITNADGSVIENIDTFNTSLSGKVIKYTIHEDETPQSFRTMEDIVFLIRYNADGSMASCNQIANNRGQINKKVKLDMATDGKIRTLNNQRVHFKITVPNDNAFDLIIKNEDTNYSGLGIEGSKFDVSINGVAYDLEQTNQIGETTLQNVTQSGELTINVAQREIGEGYKYDANNNATINLQKGTDIYSLDLLQNQDGYIDDENAQTTKAIIKVDEEYGTVTVTFTNETKTQLTIVKQDINTSKRLPNAVFEVTACKVDSNGNEIGDTKQLTTLENNTTNNDGIIHFELGVAPQSEIWKYTFKEVVPPEGYNKIVDLTLTVTYDQYGRISNLQSNKVSRLTPIMKTQGYNCHSIYSIIKNGDVSPAYTVKVVTEDSQTRRRINGSKIYTNITDDFTGNLITVNPRTESSAKNGTISETKNLGIDGKTYTDKQIEELAKEDKDPIIVEKGLTYIDNVDFEGNINIEVSQRETADGYVFGSQHTEGNIKLKATYVPHLNDDPTVEFEVIDYDGFESQLTLDKTNRIITIKILNESNVMFNINTKTPGEKGTPIQGSSYNITAEIQTATDTILTDINKTTSMSDEKGQTKTNVGNSFAGKTVVYMLHQNTPSGYQSIDDIKLEVKFDSSGNIKYIEPLSSEDNITIDYSKTEGGKNIYLEVYNRRIISDYRIFVEKHAQDTDEENMYGKLLTGAKYHIIINQQNSGVEMIEWTATTNRDGLIEIPYILDGVGYITITIEELQAPEGYKEDDVRILKLFRNINTGEFEQIDGDVNFECNEDNTEVYLKPIDNQEDNKYTLVINKYSTATKTRIKNNQAQFKAELIKKDDIGNITYQEEIENIYTDTSGKAVMDNLTMPEELGNYILKITEEKEPKGYIKLENPVEIGITFGKDSQNNTIIESVNAQEVENASISTFKKQLIGVNIQNDVDRDLEEDEYALDITKVDSTTMEGIENMAIFKVWLPDKNETAVYAETKITQLGAGKLEYCYIEQDKDYKVRLTHMKKPTIEQIKESPNQKVIQEYTFQEVVAPDGYALDSSTLTLEVEFGIKVKEDGTQEVVITNAKTNDETKIQLTSVYEQELSANVLNNEKASSYTVHYEANTDQEVKNIPADQNKLAGIPLTIDANIPVREGYTFVEWNTEPNGSGTTFNPAGTYALDADVTLYAIWNIAQYKVHYEQNAPIDPNTGVAIGLVTNIPEDQVKAHNIELILDDDQKTPIISNVANYYEFAGWNTKEDGTGTQYDEKSVYNINEDLNLYAQWNYIIHYNANVPTDSNGFPLTTPANNIPTDQSQSVNSTQDVVIDDLDVYKNPPTMEGYIFKQWNTLPDGTGDTYNPNDTYKQRKGIDLYAIWQYEIIYSKNTPVDENGFAQNVTINNMPSSPQIENVNTKAKITNNIPEMEPNNYVFKQWNTMPDGTGNSYNADDEYSGNISITLYAIWDISNGLYLKIPEHSQYEIGENNTKEYKDGDKYISNIIPEFNLNRNGTQKQTGTTVEEFFNNIDTNASNKIIKDKDGNILENDDLVGTGAILSLTKNNENIEIALSIIGDLNGNGQIDINDQSELLVAYKKRSAAKQYFMDKYPSSELNINGELLYKSSDLNDNKIGTDINDLSVMQLIRGYKFEESTGITGLKLWKGGN